MIRFRKSTVGAATALAALMLLPAPGFANSEHAGVRGALTVQKTSEGAQLANLGRGGPAGGPNVMAPGPNYGPGYRIGPYQGYGMMSPGMIGHRSASAR